MIFPHDHQATGEDGVRKLLDEYWLPVKDTDPRAVALFTRHYSCANTAERLLRYGFSGKGECMVLITLKCDALFCWRKVEGRGINCSVFHNESEILSSVLIKEACKLAWSRWGQVRLYTYVNPRKLNKHGDGNCFKKAGWVKLRKHTVKNKLIELEITPWP